MADFLTTNDAARLLGVAPATVLYYDRTGRLKAVRTEGGMRLFRRVDVERFARERKSLRAGRAS